MTLAKRQDPETWRMKQ